jgi:putative FmdB family regulatory protein
LAVESRECQLESPDPVLADLKEAAAVPTYQYSCTECGHFFEQFQSFSEDSLTTCPQCEGRLRKVFNAVGVVFKGSGFYRTDSRSSSGDGGGSEGSTTSDSKTSTSDKGGSKSDTKGGATSDSSSSSSTSTSSKAGSAA